MLTMSDEESDLYEAVRAGANGYLLKDVPGEEIADGLRAVQSGQSLISPSMASTLLSEFATMIKKHEQVPTALVPKLTDRELQVLKLVARGMANKAIAADLFISENTVKNHVRNILESSSCTRGWRRRCTPYARTSSTCRTHRRTEGSRRRTYRAGELRATTAAGAPRPGGTIGPSPAVGRAL